MGESSWPLPPAGVALSFKVWPSLDSWQPLTVPCAIIPSRRARHAAREELFIKLSGKIFLSLHAPTSCVCVYRRGLKLLLSIQYSISTVIQTFSILFVTA